jgi:hypothetical protein
MDEIYYFKITEGDIPYNKTTVLVDSIDESGISHNDVDSDDDGDDGITPNGVLGDINRCDILEGECIKLTISKGVLYGIPPLGQKFRFIWRCSGCKLKFMEGYRIDGPSSWMYYKNKLLK